jgi:hypothetical protein
VWLGHSATLHSHATLHPYFASPGLATQALIRAGKTSPTAGTLCAMGAKIYWELLNKKQLTKNKNSLKWLNYEF